MAGEERERRLGECCQNGGDQNPSSLRAQSLLPLIYPRGFSFGFQFPGGNDNYLTITGPSHPFLSGAEVSTSRPRSGAGGGGRGSRGSGLGAGEDAVGVREQVADSVRACEDGRGTCRAAPIIRKSECRKEIACSGKRATLRGRTVEMSCWLGRDSPTIVAVGG